MARRGAARELYTPVESFVYVTRSGLERLLRPSEIVAANDEAYRKMPHMLRLVEPTDLPTQATD
jgi:hypothetical protein